MLEGLKESKADITVFMESDRWLVSNEDDVELLEILVEKSELLANAMSGVNKLLVSEARRFVNERV